MKRLYKEKWTLALHSLFAFIGALLFQIIYYFVKGKFNFGAIVGSLTGVIIIILINAIYVYRKSDKTPEVDERVRNNIIKYVAYSSQIVFLLLMVVLTVFTAMGIENISTIYLWVIVLINMCVIGIGAMIVKFR